LRSGRGPVLRQRYGAGMFSLRRPSQDDLARIAAEQDARELSYPEQGATRGTMPAGYHHDQWEADLGSFDAAAFDRLAVVLSNWRAQRGAGLTIYPPEPVRPGLTFAFCFRLAGVYVTAAGRVVYLISEPDRRGFAYGTLPHHPEQGEEAFQLIRDGTRILFRVTAFSRPAHPLARLGAPVSRMIQARLNRAYLRAMHEAATTTPP
jgi:uncharacterized protein (UPF0548 family)